MERRPAGERVSDGHDWWWIFDPRCSLRARAALLAGGGTLALALLLSWSTGLVFRRTLETQLASTFETLAFQVGDKLDRTIYERYRTLQLGAALAALREADVPAARRREALDALQETSPDLVWVGLADASGNITAATSGLFERTNAQARPWFQAARERPFIGNPREIPELARAVPAPVDGDARFLELAVPVAGANGQWAGVLAAQLRWNWARDTQLSVIPESAGRVHLGVTVYGAASDVLLDSGATGWTQPPGPPSIGESRRLRGALIETSAGGTRYLTGYARSRGVREFHGLGWLTVVRQPIEDAFAPVAPLQRTVAACGFVLSLIAGVAAWVAVGGHARRLRVMGAAAERIREGDVLAVLPRPQGETEMAGMCGALGDLVEDLRSKQEKLLAENARLTAQQRERERERESTKQ